ncbi:AtzH-like domain-containing protein [Agromyces sp. LHK192]|uniref:AtzH-like domain-containing protein n=1 Tax=Agromyces sp. LHK192 TaxID=2498704 RepID=UPI000FDB947D|nr:AtzH-like domain-containing protein [Agromyces sp. LHK192]
MTGFPDDIPADLFTAFDRYERAILSNDLDALDAAFAPGDRTMRGDGAGLLVGHDAIHAFRSLRGGVPSRSIERIEYRPLADGIALLVSVSRFHDGGTGLQTQVWERHDDGWRITAAHVTPRPQAFDRTIWRVVGDPLAPADAESGGAIAGLAVAVKDVFAVAGHPIGAGNPAFLAEARPEGADAAAVGALRRAGAVVRGIARTDEFAYSIAGDNVHTGTPPNGALPGALPGGSSSGPGSAVATGQADIGLATDTAGSVRVPASYQGLWGIRTTHGLVPRDGMLPLAPSFDAVGYLTRDAETLQRVVDAVLDTVLDTALDEGPVGDLPWRLLVADEALAATEPETARAFEALLVRLAASDDGPRLGRVAIGELDEYAVPFRTVQGGEAWRSHGAWVTAHPAALGDAVAARFAAASEVTAEAEAAARDDLAALRERLHHLVRDAVLILPTVPGPAPARTVVGAAVDAGQADRIRSDTLRLTTPASVAGLPAISIPLLTVDSPLGAAPVGVSLIGAPGSDRALVRTARRLAAVASPMDAP